MVRLVLSFPPKISQYLTELIRHLAGVSGYRVQRRQPTSKRFAEGDLKILLVPSTSAVRQYRCSRRRRSLRGDKGERCSDRKGRVNLHDQIRAQIGRASCRERV